MEPASDPRTQAVLDLSAVVCARRGLTHDLPRLDVLLGLLPTCRRVGLGTVHLERELEHALDRQDRRRTPESRALVRWVRAAAARGVRTPLLRHAVRGIRSESRAAQRERLVQLELITGDVAAARARAAALRPGLERRAFERLITKGTFPDGEYVGDKHDLAGPERFPVSESMIEDLARGSGDPERRLRVVQRATEQLTGRARQSALAATCIPAYRARGLRTALSYAARPRYASERKRGLWLVLRCALRARNWGDARQVVRLLPTRSLRERGRLALARALLRGGRRREAWRLLRGVRDVRLLAEAHVVRMQAHLDDGRPVAANEAYRIACESLARADVLPQRWELARGLSLQARLSLCALRSGWSAFLHDGAHETRLLGSCARRVDRSTAFRRALLRAADRSGLARAALAADGHSEPRTSAALVAEDLLLRSEAALAAFESAPAALDSPLLAGLRGDAPPACPQQRAAYDEGVALSPRMPARRHALTRASSRAVRAALDAGAEPDETLRTRLRTLASLGGASAVRSLVDALRRTRAASALATEVFAVLGHIDRAAASEFFLEASPWLSDNPAQADVVAARLEADGALPPGLGASWLALSCALRPLGRSRAQRWLTLLRAEGTALTPELVAGLCASLERARSIPADPTQLLRNARAVTAALWEQPLEVLLDHLRRKPRELERFSWIAPARLGPRAKRFESADWRALIQKACGHAQVHPGILKQGRALLTRSAPPARVTPIDCDTPHELRLRLLDERRDLLTYLRFADVAMCCFHSESRDYRWSQRHVLDYVRDPLSFCFHLEERTGDDERWRPRGFVMGGLGEVDGRGVALVNGLYLDKRAARHRAGVLRAVEQQCRAVGLVALGIASKYGGEGPLPAEYRRQRVLVTRRRALQREGRPVATSYDDIGRTVNRPASLGHLYWKPL